jgi:hypothetical protein
MIGIKVPERRYIYRKNIDSVSESLIGVTYFAIKNKKYIAPPELSIKND